MFVVAAALALIDQPGVGAEEIVRRAMKIAGDICVYTNHNVLLEIIDPIAMAKAKKEKEEKENNEKLGISTPVVIVGTSEEKVVEEVVSTPPPDVIPTGY